MRVYTPVKSLPLTTTLERLPLRLCEWLLRNSFRGTVGLRTGEVVTDLLCEQVQVTLVMPGWE